MPRSAVVRNNRRNKDKGGPVGNDKYVVLKREDWDRLYDEIVGRTAFTTANEIPTPLDDAVVIRRQDFFAGPALHSYAANIGLAAKLSKPSPTSRRLQTIADYFHEQAVLADEEGKKVPD